MVKVVHSRTFKSGNSVAVRLPKEFRFEGTEVYVRRMGDEVVLSARGRPSMQSLVDALDGFEPGFQLERQQPELADAREPVLPRARKRK